MQKIQTPAIEAAVAFTAMAAAAATGLPRQTIDRAIKEGALRAMRSGRRHIILREDLVDWLRACREVGRIPTPISAADRERLAALNRARQAARG